MGEFVSFLRSLKILPDIILPQETFLKSRKSFKLRGCRVERLDRTDDRHGGGIMTRIRESLPYSSSVISENPECLITSIIRGSATMKIVNFYVPPGKIYSSEQLELILNHSSEWLICGDLNARSPMFGSCLSDSRGKIMEELVHKNNLVALNTGMGTHLARQQLTWHWLPLTKLSKIYLEGTGPEPWKRSFRHPDRHKWACFPRGDQITLNKHEECKLEFFPTEISQHTSPGATVGRPRGEYELCHSEHSASCQTKYSCPKGIFGKTACSLLERKLPTGN